MGRALFSQSYSSPPPIVHKEPETQPPAPYTYEKWSSWNSFDPDADEFFEDAVYEAFVPRIPREEEDSDEQAETLIMEGNSSAASSEGSDRGSPMAVGSGPDAYPVTDAYYSATPLDWDGRYSIQNRQISTLASALPMYAPGRTRQRDERLADIIAMRREGQGQGQAYTSVFEFGRGSARRNRARSATLPAHPPFLPPSSFRTSDPLSDSEDDSVESSVSFMRRTVDITPIDVNVHPPLSMTVRPASPLSPVSPTSFYPSTPPSTSHLTFHNFTPSPPPTVTPRIYSWPNLHPGINAPTSPSPMVTPTNTNTNTATSTSPSIVATTGPLTNPNARMSLAHIAPTLIRVRDTVM